MSRSLVILCYPKINFEKDYVYYWIPYSILTIAKPIIEGGIADIIIFDGNQQTEKDWVKIFDSHLDDILCIGISIMTGGGQIKNALRLANIAKGQKNCPPIVFGGPHTNVLPEQTCKHPLVDVVLTGPGQVSMPLYVKALLGNRELSHIPGLFCEKESNLIIGPPNPPKSKLLGRFPWQLIDIQKYIRDDPNISHRTLNYVSSQGCVYNCRFCYELTYKKKYSAIPADILICDVQYLNSEYKIQGIKFYDADFFINLKRVQAFVQKLLDLNLNIRWAASINPNDIIRAQRFYPNLLDLIAKSGCSRLLMGLESGSDRVLNEVVNKETNCEVILHVAKTIAQNGIIGAYTFIIGFPGETQAEQDETYRLIDKLRNLSPQPEIRVHVYAPYPGTPLFELALDYGFRPPTTLQEWSDYDYYDSQTPWTDFNTVKNARNMTKLRLSPKDIKGG